MSSATHQLPMPAGARFAAPSRRGRVDVWAAPDPAALLLDPWAPPVGRAIATTAVSPWPAPVASQRIGWMAAPPSLLPPPAGIEPVSVDPAPHASTRADRPLAALRALAVAPIASVPDAPAIGTSESLSLEPSVSDTMRRVGSIDSVGELAAPDPTTRVDEAPRRDIARWRVAAVVTGIGAAAVAVVTLITSVF